MARNQQDVGFTQAAGGGGNTTQYAAGDWHASNSSGALPVELNGCSNSGFPTEGVRGQEPRKGSGNWAGLDLNQAPEDETDEAHFSDCISGGVGEDIFSRDAGLGYCGGPARWDASAEEQQGRNVPAEHCPGKQGQEPASVEAEARDSAAVQSLSGARHRDFGKGGHGQKPAREPMFYRRTSPQQHQPQQRVTPYSSPVLTEPNSAKRRSPLLLSAALREDCARSPPAGETSVPGSSPYGTPGQRSRHEGGPGKPQRVEYSATVHTFRASPCNPEASGSGVWRSRPKPGRKDGQGEFIGGGSGETSISKAVSGSTPSNTVEDGDNPNSPAASPALCPAHEERQRPSIISLPAPGSSAVAAGPTGQSSKFLSELGPAALKKISLRASRSNTEGGDDAHRDEIRTGGRHDSPISTEPAEEKEYYFTSADEDADVSIVDAPEPQFMQLPSTELELELDSEPDTDAVAEDAPHSHVRLSDMDATIDGVAHLSVRAHHPLLPPPPVVYSNPDPPLERVGGSVATAQAFLPAACEEGSMQLSIPEVPVLASQQLQQRHVTPGGDRISVGEGLWNKTAETVAGERNFGPCFSTSHTHQCCMIESNWQLPLNCIEVTPAPHLT